VRLLSSIRKFISLSVACLALLPVAGGQDSQRVGFLAVTVTVGGDHFPAVHAFVAVRGYPPTSKEVIALTPTKDGFFETSLPPGIYDVFVSEDSTFPACKRVKVAAGDIAHYEANLTVDIASLEK